MSQPTPSFWALERDALAELLRILQAEGYQTIGPVVHQGAIVYAPVTDLHELALGWRDEQGAGHYRLRPPHQDEADVYFSFTVGPQSWKTHLFPPQEVVWEVHRQNGELLWHQPQADEKWAFIGVRACELAAIRIQDRVFLQGPYEQPSYAQRRRAAFIVAVECTHAGATCFCASMGTGPAVREGFDLALTELDHIFVVRVGSPRGQAVLARLPHRAATETEVQQARSRVEAAAQQMGRQVDKARLPHLLRASLESPHWEVIAQRCLGCANCTFVCPTCFCFTFEDVSDLTGQHAHRRRKWDSCFNLDFTYTGGRPIRASIAARYRQWLTHKLSWWVDQFGVMGCVGCGRCITWCPVGIDWTVEVQALAATTTQNRAQSAALAST